MHLKVVCNPSSSTKKKKEKQKNKKNKTHNIVEHYVVSHVTEFYGMCEAAEKDLYAVLGASPSDSLQQLRHRYQQLALQYHPDRLGGECSSEAESGVKKFLEVDAAWRILSDQNTRRQYDLQRRVRELKQDWPVDSTVYLEDMTWDQVTQPPFPGCSGDARGRLPQANSGRSAPTTRDWLTAVADD
ncbi:dnaJ homolog subfamily C member 24 isoform X2 [Micropterus salmoides]|uniref:dnaJ homolog subfamily C member 24 isoform X2 n=1 Tax=Micropterus salmoides TaxID=27706 RepID=UPI0018ECCBC1|nr:dnaJ homolog subfamily C member 24 isoform X2 [Micropterus salmoides]